MTEEPKCRPSTARMLVRLVVKGAWEVLSTVVPALMIALIVNTFVAEAAVVEQGPSMEPNLYRGYRVMTDKISYRIHPPRRGDVVIIDPPGGGTRLIKRVVALPGEVIEVWLGRVWIDGQELDEPWVQQYGGPAYPPTEVPAGYVFFLGDNRPNSHDSRAIGPVPLSAVRGRVWLVYWPLQKLQLEP